MRAQDTDPHPPAPAEYPLPPFPPLEENALERAARRSMRLMFGAGSYGALMGAALGLVLVLGMPVKGGPMSALDMIGILFRSTGGGAVLFAGAGACAGAVGGLLRKN